MERIPGKKAQKRSTAALELVAADYDDASHDITHAVTTRRGIEPTLTRMPASTSSAGLVGQSRRRLGGLIANRL
jgi:hypothetical protein